MDYELFERRGTTVAVGGLCWNAAASFGEDPLEGIDFPTDS